MDHETLRSLATLPPPPDTTATPFAGGPRKKLSTAREINSRIAEMESALGIPHRPRIFNLSVGNEILSTLESMMAARGIAAPETSSTAAPLPVVSAADPEKAAAVAAGPQVRPLADYLKLSPDMRQQFVEDGYRITHADFSDLNSIQKSKYLAANGRLFTPPPPPSKTLSAYLTLGADDRLAFARAGRVLSRADFEQLGHPDRNAFIRLGGKLSD